MWREKNKKMTDFSVPRGLKRFWSYSWIYFLVAFVVFVGGYGIIEFLFPAPPVKFVYTWDGILMFMAVCAGVGWVLHGTGFLLVKVNR